MFGLGMGEAIILGGFFLLLFGTKKLPALGHSLGKSIVDFKKGLQGIEGTDQEIPSIDKSTTKKKEEEKFE